MSPEDFERLRRYLEVEVHPIFDAFVLSHDLTRATRLGRYPRVRAERTRDDGAVLWIEFCMALDPQGRYFEEFFEGAPHELGAGVFIDVQEKEELVRYHETLALYMDRPYVLAVKTLKEDLERLWEQVASWPNDAVFHGKRNVLRR